MSSRSTQPAEQRSHRGVSPHEEHHDSYLNGYSSGSQETSPPPPSYSVVDGFIQFDPDLKGITTEAHANTSLVNSPSQVPFDDLIGDSIRPNSLPVTSPHNQDPSESRMANLRLENQPNSNRKSDSPPLQAQQRQSDDVRQPRQRPELPHASRSTPDTRKLLGKISELEEVDPYGESPFEAARRAQRQADLDAAKSPSGQTYVNGHFPSIKPGEIMPSQFLRPANGPPSFFLPLEAPPFPPPVHPPIRPAHFPPNLHPPPPTSEPTRAPSQQRPPSQHIPQIPRSHSYLRAHSPSPPASRNPAPAHSDGQLPPELFRSQSQPVVSHFVPPQPTRFHSYQAALPPNASQYTNAPPPSRQHTLTPRDPVPPGLMPNGRYSVPQPPPPLPHSISPSHHHPQSPPSRSQSQHYPPGLPSRSQSQYHQPTPPHPALQDTHRQSLRAPPSQVQFVPRNASPVRLPSQNVPTPQALGTHTPPIPTGSPRPDNSRPPRPTPKPVMPQLLAPLVVQEPNLAGGGASHLQRSMSSVGNEKGGLLAKTRSILRKRSSTTGVRTHGSGAISFSPTPTMPNLMEEDMESRKSGRRLSRKK